MNRFTKGLNITFKNDPFLFITVTYIVTNPVLLVHLKYVYITIGIFVALSAVLLGRLLLKKQIFNNNKIFFNWINKAYI